MAAHVVLFREHEILHVLGSPAARSPLPGSFTFPSVAIGSSFSSKNIYHFVSLLEM